MADLQQMEEQIVELVAAGSGGTGQEVGSAPGRFGRGGSSGHGGWGGGGRGGSRCPVEEKTEFNVILTGIGANKINVIKAVREVTSLGLKEAKDLVDGAPKPIKEGVSQGRGGDHQEEVHRCRRDCRSQVVVFFSRRGRRTTCPAGRR